MKRFEVGTEEEGCIGLYLGTSKQDAIQRCRVDASRNGMKTPSPLVTNWIANEVNYGAGRYVEM